MRCKALILLLAAGLAVSSWAAAQTKAGKPPARQERYGGGACASCPRDTQGRIQRSAAVRREFLRSVPRPEKCRAAACQIDHFVPLHCGGKDIVANLQWLTVAEHRAKTKRERDCAAVLCPSIP